MTFSSIINNIIVFLGNLILLIIAVAVLIFFYGLVGYITNSGDESKRKESTQYIIYGIFGIFVMVAVWGLVALLAGFIGESIGVPQIR
jgi:uncharacterized membrane protein YidH (DUF202 family)